MHCLNSPTSAGRLTPLSTSTYVLVSRNLNPNISRFDEVETIKVFGQAFFKKLAEFETASQGFY